MHSLLSVVRLTTTNEHVSGCSRDAGFFLQKGNLQAVVISLKNCTFPAKVVVDVDDTVAFDAHDCWQVSCSHGEDECGELHGGSLVW